MAGDARAFLAERLLGDLDDDILASLQHFRNKLRASRGAGTASLVATIVSWAAGTTAFETRSASGASAAIGTSTTAVGAATTAAVPIRTSTTAIASAVASTATIRPLEARTRVAADARGVARKVFTRSRWAANARGTSLAREENHVLLDGPKAFRDGFAWSRRDHFLFDMFALNLLVLGFFMLSVLRLGVFMLDIFVLSIFMLTVRFGVFGALLSDVRGEFRPVGRAACFDFLGFFCTEFRNCFGVNFLVFARFLFRLVLFENGATRQSIGIRYCSGFFVLGLREIGGERGNLIFT
jgi:hypothetical protein